MMTIDELKTALKNMRLLQLERQQKISKADRLEDRLSSVGVSSVYNADASHQRSRHAPQETLDEILDLRRSALKDLDVLADLELILEPEVDRLPGYDLRQIIKWRYFCEWNIEEIQEVFEESEPDYVRKVLRQFFTED